MEFKRDGAKYVLRNSGDGVPTADSYKVGSKRLDLKIRLDDRR